MPTPVITTNAASWAFQQNNIERLMDHAALTSAHPDDTLILAGPARYGAYRTQAADQSTILDGGLLPIGMVQSFNAMLQKPTQPMQAIGSGRMFFVSGKAQGNAQIARLFVNGRNLLRVLYTNAVQAGLDVSQFDDKACITNPTGGQTGSTFFMNLDSELFLIPFGLACFFRDKIHNKLGAFYLELCALNSYNIAFNAGQNMILENVSLLFDRALPMDMGNWGNRLSGATLTESSFTSAKILGGVPDSAAPGLAAF
jgi:hypothetical protein